MAIMKNTNCTCKIFVVAVLFIISCGSSHNAMDLVKSEEALLKIKSDDYNA